MIMTVIGVQRAAMAGKSFACIAGALFFSCIFMNVSCSKSHLTEKEAEVIINNFYIDNVPEPIIDRHLVDAGAGIVPYLLIEIQNIDMPRRGYAILAIGKIGKKEAIPVLKIIFEDKAESTYIRINALRAIWNIDKILGEELCNKYKGTGMEIDRTIELLREGMI